MSTLVETKIDTTHRLEADGRWEIASRFRHRRRQELREGGLPKSAAREAAWGEMSERFPPIDEDWKLTHLVASKYPSTFVPKHLLWRFRNAWSATVQILGFLGSQDAALRETDFIQTAGERFKIDRQIGSAMGSQETLSFLLEKNDPSLLTDLEAELQVVASALDGDQPGITATREELALVLAAFPLLRRSAEVYWPLPDEI